MGGHDHYPIKSQLVVVVADIGDSGHVGVNPGTTSSRIRNKLSNKADRAGLVWELLLVWSALFRDRLRELRLQIETWRDEEGQRNIEFKTPRSRHQHQDAEIKTPEYITTRDTHTRRRRRGRELSEDDPNVMPEGSQSEPKLTPKRPPNE